MIMSFRTVLLGLLSALVLVGVSWASALQSLDEVEQAAYLYAMEQSQAQYDMPQLEMGRLDSRLRLAQCDGDLQAFSQQGQVRLGQQTIGVKCVSSTPWTVYVQMTIKLMRPVVVASRALPAQHILTASDLYIQQMDVGTLRYPYEVETHKLIGQQLKYPLARGVVMSQSYVKPEKLVRRGERITLVAEAGSMKVKMNGTALADASIGQRVRVKNNSSKRVVEGIVDGPGLVRVQL